MVSSNTSTVEKQLRLQVGWIITTNEDHDNLFLVIWMYLRVKSKKGTKGVLLRQKKTYNCNYTTNVALKEVLYQVYSFFISLCNDYFRKYIQSGVLYVLHIESLFLYSFKY